jgi:subtilase family serine protease
MRVRKKTARAAMAAGVSAATVLGTLALAGPSVASPVASPRHEVSLVPRWVQSAQRIGTPAAAAQQTVLVTLQGRDPAGLAALARAVSSPGSPQYRHFITPAQFTARFAPTDAAARAVATWVRSQGLTITGRDKQNAYLQVRGTTRQLESAFHTTLATFRRDGRTVMAPVSPVFVPGTLSAQVAGVVGLNTAPRPTTQHISLSENAPGFSSSSLAKSTARLEAMGRAALGGQLPRAAGKTAGRSFGPGTSHYPVDAETLGCGQYYGDQTASDLPPAVDSATTGTPPAVQCGYLPAQLRKAFGLQPDATGQGETVGITLWCNSDQLATANDAQPFTADLAQWASMVGAQPWAPGQFTVLPPAGGYSTTQCPDPNAQEEQALDVESIHTFAPDAKIIFSSAAAPTDAALIAALHALVDTHQANVISDSWGEAENGEDTATMAAYDQVFEEAAAEGISVLFSSGDDGDNTGITGTPQAWYPASDPWITSVGGTSDGIDANSRLAFTDAWFTTGKIWTGNTYGFGARDFSAYFFAGGGGTSAVYAQPWYQAGVVPAALAGSTTPMRVYPDLSNIASPLTPFRVGLSNGGGLGNSFVLFGVGGTSLASPTTAAEVADAIAQSGRPVGFLNPALYASGGQGLTDISNDSPGHAFAQTLLDGFVTYQFTDGAQSETMQEDANASDTADWLHPVTTTLEVSPGYDNLTGLGAVTSYPAFARALRH